MDSSPQTGPAERSGQDLLGVFDRGLQALLLLATVLLAWSWTGLEGYQIADAVEYLERAQDLAEGRAGVHSIRAFGYSGLLVPLFTLADGLEALTGLEAGAWIVHAARLLQIALTLGLIAITARIAGALGGRSAGYAAAALLIASPTVMQWGVSAVSGIAAALLIALAIEALVVDDGKYGPTRGGWVAGLGLGGAFLMAYQTIMVVVPIFALIFLRRSARPKVRRSMVVLAVALCVFTQMVLDYFYYGEFGKSVAYYFVLNFGTIVPVQLHRLGELTGLGVLQDAARAIYTAAGESVGAQTGEGQLLERAGQVQSKLPRHWYLTNLPSALTWPGVALVATGIVYVLIERSRMPLSLLVIVVFNVAAMSEKGSKEFRLWLPFLSMVAVLGGLGYRAVVGHSRTRHAVGVAALVLAVVLGADAHASRNRTRYGAFWRAMSHVNEAVRNDPALAPPGAGEPGRSVRVASTFHWSVLLRERGPIELVKLPTDLDHWDDYGAAERAETLALIDGLDWLIAHLPALTEHPEVLRAVAGSFAVRASFFDRSDAGDFGPVLVLSRAPEDESSPGELRLYETRPDADPAAWAAARGLRHPIRFGRHGQLELLGTEFDRLAGDGHGWVTYHWYGARLPRDATVVDRITCPGSPHSWHNNHQPAYGMHPSTSWPEEGWILSEGYLVVPEADPYRAAGPERFVGEPYMSGDLIPGDLWIDVGVLGSDGQVARRLGAFRPADGQPVKALAPPQAPPTPEGLRTSEDGMTRVASVLIPVTARQRARAASAGSAGRLGSLGPGKRAERSGR